MTPRFIPRAIQILPYAEPKTLKKRRGRAEVAMKIYQNTFAHIQVRIIVSIRINRAFEFVGA
jgi:hypothetical protein